MEIITAKGNLRIPSILATIGGIGLGVSIILPYFRITFIVSVTISPLDFGILIWGPLALASVLSIVAGINLGTNLNYNPKTCLIISIICCIFTGGLLFLSIERYNNVLIEEYGAVLIPLTFDIGLVLAALSSLMIIISTITVFSNQTSYNFLLHTFRQQTIQLYHQRSHQQSRPILANQIRSAKMKEIVVKFCAYCGKEKEHKQKFCIHCGADLDTKSTTDTSVNLMKTTPESD